MAPAPGCPPRTQHVDVLKYVSRNASTGFLDNLIISDKDKNRLKWNLWEDSLIMFMIC